MTTEQAPPLAPVWEKLIDRATVHQLFAEVLSHAELLSVREKGGAMDYAGADHPSLDDVQAHLLAGAIHGVQLRYLYDGQEWCDTILKSHDGWKLLRVKQ